MSIVHIVYVCRKTQNLFGEDIDLGVLDSGADVFRYCPDSKLGQLLETSESRALWMDPDSHPGHIEFEAAFAPHTGDLTYVTVECHECNMKGTAAPLSKK